MKRPNGHTNFAKYFGSMSFPLGFLVYKLLWGPRFSLNLLYVPKLGIESQCVIVFYDLHRSIGKKELEDD